MATKFDRFGPARGVNYFSAGNAPMQPVGPEAGPENLIVEGPIEPVIRPTGGGDNFVPSPERRDLAKDPLSQTEVSAARTISNLTGLLPIPGASLLGVGIDYNLGKSGYAADSVGSRMGRNVGLGYDTVRSAQMAAMQSLPGFLGGDESYGLTPIDQNNIDMDSLNPASIQAQMAANGIAFSANQENPDNPTTWSSPVSTPTAEATTLAPMAPESSGGGNGVSGGFQGGNDSYNSSGGDGGWGGGGGWGFADGGPVGLTEPTYTPNGFSGEAPRSLAAMGFADGGGVGMNTPAGGNSPEMVTMRVNEMMRNPQIQQVVQQAVGAAMQSGELTPEELVMLGRIAEASIHNPALYPKLRQFAAQQGLSPLPASFDQRVIMVLIVASKMMGQAGAPIGGGQPTQPGQVPPTDQAQMQNPTGMANGGMLRGPGTGRSDSIGTVNETTGQPVKVANGEYVIPAHVVKAKGQDFFDKMLRQYAPLTPSEG